MKKNDFRKVWIILLTVVTGSMLFVGCSKDGETDPDPDSPNFKPEDFKVTILSTEFDPDGDGDTEYFDIDYEVTNLRDEPFDGLEDGDYDIRFVIKTTDGAEYNAETFIGDLTAKGSETRSNNIAIPAGKTVDQSTFRYEIYLDE